VRIGRTRESFQLVAKGRGNFHRRAFHEREKNVEGEEVKKKRRQIKKQINIRDDAENKLLLY
jgi:hypothetical protein